MSAVSSYGDFKENMSFKTMNDHVLVRFFLFLQFLQVATREQIMIELFIHPLSIPAQSYAGSGDLLEPVPALLGQKARTVQLSAKKLFVFQDSSLHILFITQYESNFTFF